MNQNKKNEIESFDPLLNYIDEFWRHIIHSPRPDGDVNFLPLRYGYVTPNIGQYNYLFYWDSYFIMQGLIQTEKEWVIPEIVENFADLFHKHGIIPNFNHPAALGRSQPPLLTSMILDGYNVLTRGEHISPAIQLLSEDPKTWLMRHANTAQQEYETVWQGKVQVYGYNHFVPEANLNRYGNRDGGDALYSEFESGWDFTSRFYNRCDEFLPIDLNCFLYKYECDLAHINHILEHQDLAQVWAERADRRKQRINELMWNEETGFFFDYDYIHHTRSTFYSLAGFIPLWTGLASPDQAKRMMKHLKRFESDYGLTITDELSLPPRVELASIPEPYRLALDHALLPKQWDWPHIWSPIEYLVVEGLLKYNFTQDAIRIMSKSVNTHLHVFEKEGVLLEKLDATTGGRARDFHYPNQEGFGWTNAVVVRYVNTLKNLGNIES